MEPLLTYLRQTGGMGPEDTTSPRSAVQKHLTETMKAAGLINPKDGREFLLNEELQAVFKRKKLTYSLRSNKSLRHASHPGSPEQEAYRSEQVFLARQVPNAAAQTPRGCRGGDCPGGGRGRGRGRTGRGGRQRRRG